MYRISLLALCLVLPLKIFAEEDAVDRYAQETLVEWDIPGLSLAIVHKGQEVKVKGYGVRRRGSQELVDADTLFQICSLTKAFTAYTVNQLVKQNKLAWEMPIKAYLPNFVLKDPVATEEVTLRDLLTHRTGLPGIPQMSWALWYQTNRSTEDLIYRLRFVDPAFPLRAHFAYNNVTYAVASEVVSSVAGIPWKQFCANEIFIPLGMKRTSLSYETLLKDDNVASAHLKSKIQEAPINWLNWNSLAAAAGINSSAHDMALWLKFCLENASISELQKPQTLFEPEGFLGKQFSPIWSIYNHNQAITNYGLGWMSYTLDNKVVFFHTGRSDGMQSILAIMPEEQLGIVILSNESVQHGPACLLNILIDHFLHKKEHNWHQEAHTIVAAIGLSIDAEQEERGAQRNKNLPTTLPLQSYNGVYIHPAYGLIRINESHNSLFMTTFSQEQGELIHWQGDEFDVKEIGLAYLPWIINFQVNAEKTAVSGFTIKGLGFFERSSS